MLVVAGLLVAGMPIQAAKAAPGMKLELNKLEPSDGACRAYVVIENDTGAVFATFRYALVIFDGEGVVARRLALETAPLPAGKTSLKVFDLAGLPCGDIGRILVNDVLECADATGTRTDCLQLVQPSSRSTTPLIR